MYRPKTENTTTYFIGKFLSLSFGAKGELNKRIQTETHSLCCSEYNNNSVEYSFTKLKITLTDTCAYYQSNKNEIYPVTKIHFSFLNEEDFKSYFDRLNISDLKKYHDKDFSCSIQLKTLAEKKEFIRSIYAFLDNLDLKKLNALADDLELNCKAIKEVKQSLRTFLPKSSKEKNNSIESPASTITLRANKLL